MKRLAPPTLALLALLILGSCTPTLGSTPKTVAITHVYYTIYNVPSDWWSATATVKPALVYHFKIYYQGNLSASDIASARIYRPGTSGAFWSIDPQKYFDPVQGSIGDMSYSFWNISNSSELPIGVFTAKVVLTNGVSSVQNFTMGVPGSVDPGSYSLVYSETETTPSSLTACAPALLRPEVTAFTYSGGSFQISFTVKGPNAFNGFVWLYDGTGAFVGGLPYFRLSTGENYAGLNGGSGLNLGANSLIVGASDIKFGTTTVDPALLPGVAWCRIVLQDGLEYSVGGAYTTYDYRAISPLFAKQ